AGASDGVPVALGPGPARAACRADARRRAGPAGPRTRAPPPLHRSRDRDRGCGDGAALDLHAHDRARRLPRQVRPCLRRLSRAAARGGCRVKVLIVSGIWPPDVGGPASHAPEVASFLGTRGHDVEVVTTADSAPAPEEYPVRWVRRSLPPGVRHAEGIRLVRE